MRMTLRKQSALAVAAALATLGATTPAHAVFLGLEPGDVIDRIGFSIGAGASTGATFTDTAAATGDILTINALANDITTEGPPAEVLTEIDGGIVDITLSVVGESLAYFGGTFFQYSATFNGAGLNPVNIYAPTGGPAAEQDGRLLVSGDFSTAPNSTLQVFFDSSGAIAPTFTFTGTFDVTGGDATFLQAFGSVGNLADVLAASSSSIPNLGVLLADGHLFSERDDGAGGSLLAACAAAITCSGAIVGTQSWTATGTGEIRPQNPSPFVPEPGTFALVCVGLAGLGATGRRRGRRRAR